MRVRYTSGSNREGRRHAQLRVHLRWITALRRALTVFGRPASRLRPVGVRPSRGTPACGLGLTGRVALGMYGQPEGDRWGVSAGPTLTLPIVLVTTERPIHIHKGVRRPEHIDESKAVGEPCDKHRPDPDPKGSWGKGAGPVVECCVPLNRDGSRAPLPRPLLGGARSAAQCCPPRCTRWRATSAAESRGWGPTFARPEDPGMNPEWPSLRRGPPSGPLLEWQRRMREFGQSCAETQRRGQLHTHVVWHSPYLDAIWQCE